MCCTVTVQGVGATVLHAVWVTPELSSIGSWYDRKRGLGQHRDSQGSCGTPCASVALSSWWGMSALKHSLHAGRCLVDRWCAECRSWKTLVVEVFQPHVRSACFRSARHREQSACTDQRCSKCSPVVSDTQVAQVCPEGVYGCGVMQ
jgi:hypothetical protein